MQKIYWLYTRYELVGAYQSTTHDGLFKRHLQIRTGFWKERRKRRRRKRRRRKRRRRKRRREPSEGKERVRGGVSERERKREQEERKVTYI